MHNSSGTATSPNLSRTRENDPTQIAASRAGCKKNATVAKNSQATVAFLKSSWKIARRSLAVILPPASDKTLVGVAVVLERYYRPCAARQFILALFCRATLTTSVEGIIK